MDWILPALVAGTGIAWIIARHDPYARRLTRTLPERLREHARRRNAAMINNDWSTMQYYGHVVGLSCADGWYYVQHSALMRASVRHVRRIGVRIRRMGVRP